MSTPIADAESRATRLAWAAGGTLAAVLLLVALLLGWQERRNALAFEMARGELLARQLEDQATRGFESSSTALGALAGLLASAREPLNERQLAPLLSQAMPGLPLLRSVALVDLDGRVLASSVPQETGLQLPLATLGPLPETGAVRIGPPLPGRGLAALARHGASPRGLAFVPLLRGLQLPGGRPLLLLGVMNPDAFGNYQESALQGEAEGARALLLGYDGRLLAASRLVAPVPGDDLRWHAVPRGQLARHEHGALLGTGSSGTTQILAFRASRSLPLVAVVEYPVDAAQARWWQTMRWALAFGGLGIALVLAATWVGCRSLRARARARALLDEAQARVAHSERELSVLVRSVQNLLFRTDAQGRITFVNQRWAAWSGRTPEQTVGQRLRDTVLPADAARIDTLFQAGPGDLARSAAAVGIAVQRGEPRWLDIAVVPLRDRGQVVGFAGSAADVSDRWRAEQRLQQLNGELTLARDNAEEASRAKSEFIANISHELRTPLQSIVGFSELGIVRAREHERLAGMFCDIHGAGHRMLALVNDLLDVAKIDSTVGTFHVERVDLRRLVRGVARELQPLLDRQGLGLQLALGELPLTAKVDPLRIEQVLRNVLANAIKFSPTGAAIELSASVDDGLIAIRVRDHGPGVPPAELEAIFEAFVQSSRTKDGSGGTGLGLAICRKIVVAHGGSIDAANAPGGGACFTLRLPARASAETMPMPL
ncbi:ATP-binding protein [Aquabacterium sp.]|uniref:sensor histidine kinase n=1 Tax=Aquabacterium sp. TaxID=1872578 RepID=UPI0037831ECC